MQSFGIWSNGHSFVADLYEPTSHDMLMLYCALFFWEITIIYGSVDMCRDKIFTFTLTSLLKYTCCGKANQFLEIPH